jgi:hypothetical protein
VLSSAPQVKAIIAGMYGEFGVIRTERNATNELVSGIANQLKAAQVHVAMWCAWDQGCCLVTPLRLITGIM